MLRKSPGSIRRDCLDYVIVLNEVHLHRILTGYFESCHDSRPHWSTERNTPMPRSVKRLLPLLARRPMQRPRKELREMTKWLLSARFLDLSRNSSKAITRVLTGRLPLIYPV
jgi:hypothetical protein